MTPPHERPGTCREVGYLRGCAPYPRRRHRPFGLVSRDGTLVLEREADVVQAVHQTVAAEGVDLEGNTKPVLELNLQGLQVHRSPVGTAGRTSHQRLDIRIGKLHWHDSVLIAVADEDVGEVRRYHRAEAVVVKGPRGVFT